MKLFAVSILLVVGLACMATKTSQAHPKTPDALHINPSTATIHINQVQQFQVIGFAPISGNRFTWSSDRGTVSHLGEYKAPSTPGPDRVSAKYTSSTNEIFTATIIVVP